MLYTHILLYHFWKLHFNITPSLSENAPFEPNIIAFRFSLIHATCLAHLILIDIAILLQSVTSLYRYKGYDEFFAVNVSSAPQLIVLPSIDRPQTVSLKFWREARELYVELCCLTRAVDHHISHIVLLCLISDLYFICLQLFNSLK